MNKYKIGDKAIYLTGEKDVNVEVEILEVVTSYRIAIDDTNKVVNKFRLLPINKPKGFFARIFNR